MIMVLASVMLFLIAGFIGFGFGPYYLILCAAAALVVIVMALSVPRIGRIFERMTTGQLTLRATLVVGGCLALAVIYELAINRFGLAFYGAG